MVCAFHVSAGDVMLIELICWMKKVDIFVEELCCNNDKKNFNPMIVTIL